VYACLSIIYPCGGGVYAQASEREKEASRPPMTVGEYNYFVIPILIKRKFVAKIVCCVPASSRSGWLEVIAMPRLL